MCECVSVSVYVCTYIMYVYSSAHLPARAGGEHESAPDAGGSRQQDDAMPAARVALPARASLSVL